MSERAETSPDFGQQRVVPANPVARDRKHWPIFALLVAGIVLTYAGCAVSIYLIARAFTT